MKTRAGICRGVAKAGRRVILDDGCSGRHVEVVVSWISVGGLVCLHINICEWTNSVNGPEHGRLVYGYLYRLEQVRCKGKYQKRNPRMEWLSRAVYCSNSECAPIANNSLTRSNSECFRSFSSWQSMSEQLLSLCRQSIIIISLQPITQPIHLWAVKKKERKGSTIWLPTLACDHISKSVIVIS